MKKLKLSVVVPSFNQAEFIDETLACLFNQHDVGRDELEVIVIDGGSTDNSVEIIKRYADRLAYWVSEPDRGQTHALSKGFALATGDVFSWLCSDDLLEPWTVREVLDFFTNRPEVQFIYGDARWIDREGRIVKLKKEIPFNWYIWIYDHNYIPQPAAFWRRQTYEEAGGLDEAFDVAMDGDLWPRMAQLSHPHHVSRLWARMRLYPEQKNQRMRAKSNLQDREVRERLGISFRSRSRVRFCYLTAKGLRVGWKFATGCYW